MCFPFKAGCELGLATITLSTFPFQGSSSASSGEGRINTVTGQTQFLALRWLQRLREEPIWGPVPGSWLLLTFSILCTTPWDNWWSSPHRHSSVWLWALQGRVILWFCSSGSDQELPVVLMSPGEHCCLGDGCLHPSHAFWLLLHHAPSWHT